MIIIFFFLVYVRTSPIVAMNRIRRRGRPEEANIDFAYLKTLHDLHELWLMLGSHHTPAPVSNNIVN